MMKRMNTHKHGLPFAGQAMLVGRSTGRLNGAP
jgi:hypothetical protein